MRCVVKNTEIRLYDVPTRVYRAIKDRTAFLVEGHQHVPAWKKGYWDGRENLVQACPKDRGGGYRAPVGILEDVVAVAHELDIQVDWQDRRRRPGSSVAVSWNPTWKLRHYQQAAVDAVFGDHGMSTGKGCVKVPTRGGKTVIAAAIIARAKRRTLFLVSSSLLLEQAASTFEKVLGIPIGRIGEGEWDIRDVTVAMVQSLSMNRSGMEDKKRDAIRKLTVKLRAVGAHETEAAIDKKLASFNRATDLYHVDVSKYKAKDGKWRIKWGDFTLNDTKADDVEARISAVQELIANTDILFFDECHHLEGEEWRDLYQSFDCPYKIGLSATIWPEDVGDEGYPKSDIWIRAATGPIRYEISIDDLVSDGYLIAPEVVLVKSERPYVPQLPWAKVSNTILMSVERNEVILTYARRYLREGMKVLIITGLVEHNKKVVQHLEADGLRVASVIGTVPSKKRRQIIADYMAGKYDILIGTVFGEGVDLPAVECVINAEGGRSRKAARQRFRNLTPYEGKVRAVFVDIIDANNKYLAAHSLERVKEYRKESTFRIRVESAQD